eukprot:15440744-Alexandrium_andersonii.AAC.1
MHRGILDCVQILEGRRGPFRGHGEPISRLVRSGEANSSLGARAAVALQLEAKRAEEARDCGAAAEARARR